MRCLYCGKKLSLLKRAHGDEFCSPQHHDGYARQAQNALKRLLADPEPRSEPKPSAVSPIIAEPRVIHELEVAPAKAPEPEFNAPPEAPLAQEFNAPPEAPLAQESYLAQAPPAIPKLLAAGPEQSPPTAPVTPKLNLQIAVEIPAPPPVPPLASSVLAERPISASPRASDAEALEFLTDLARPSLAVSPVTEGWAEASSSKTETDGKHPSNVGQKPIFEEEFLSPWALIAKPPAADDLTIPAQLGEVGFRLMDAAQPQHHPLPATTSELRLEQSFPDVPVSKVSVVPQAAGLAGPLNKPSPPASGGGAMIQIGEAANHISAPAQCVEAVDPLAGFLSLKKIAFALPTALSGFVPAVWRPDELIPIEIAAAGASSSKACGNEVDIKPVGPRSATILPGCPEECRTAWNLYPAVAEKSQGAQAQFEPLAVSPQMDPGARPPEIRFPANSAIERAIDLHGVSNVETPAADVRAEGMDPVVLDFEPPPIELDTLSAICWRSPEYLFTGFSESAPLGFRIANSVTLLPSAAPEIFTPAAKSWSAASLPDPRLPTARIMPDAPTLGLSNLESKICVDVVQPREGSVGSAAFSSSPLIGPVVSKVLPGAEGFVPAGVIRPQMPSVHWEIRTSVLPLYQPVPKSLPARRGQVLS